LSALKPGTLSLSISTNGSKGKSELNYHEFLQMTVLCPERFVVRLKDHLQKIYK
jgi:hypothetical protein